MNHIKLLPNGDTIMVDVIFGSTERTPGEVAEALRLHAQAITSVAVEHLRSAATLAPVVKLADVYWGGYGFEWQEHGNCAVGSVAPLTTLDDAIRDAHAAGYAVRGVTMTRGTMHHAR